MRIGGAGTTYRRGRTLLSDSASLTGMSASAGGKTSRDAVPHLKTRLLAHVAGLDRGFAANKRQVLAPGLLCPGRSSSLMWPCHFLSMQPDALLLEAEVDAAEPFVGDSPSFCRSNDSVLPGSVSARATAFP